MLSVWNWFDTIAVINLPHRTDRLTEFKDEANRVGLTGAFVLDGVLNDNRTIGFNKAQYNALAFLSMHGGGGLVLEDDVIFKNHEHLEQAMSELPDDWDMCYLGANIVGTDLCSWPTPERFSKHLSRIKQAWTTHAIAYSAKGVQRILTTWMPGDQIYDDVLRCNLENMEAFIVNPMVADQRPGYSDIWQRDTDYGFFKQGNERMAL